MRTLNEDIRRMKQLFEAQHGVIEPLISERFEPSKQIEKETEYNKKWAEENKPDSDETSNFTNKQIEKETEYNKNVAKNSSNWLKIVDWLVDNMGFIKQTIQSTGEVVAMKPKTSTNPKPYWYILKDGNVSIVQQRTTDTTDPNEIPNIIIKNTPQKQSDGDNLNVFLNSLYNDWKQSPYLQKAYPDLKEKMAGIKIYSSAANPVVSSYSGSTTYKVKTGDNLTKIAKTYGVTVDQILKSNPQIKDKNMIKVGEIINIEK